MSGHSFPEPTYHDNYSEDEGNEDKVTGASSAGEENEDEDEDDFVQKPRNDLGPANKKRRLSQRDDRPASSSIPIAAPSSASSVPLPRPLPGPILEPSIINAEPLDEFIREIADWILRVATGRDYIEVSIM